MKDQISLARKFEAVIHSLFEAMGLGDVLLETDRGWDLTVADTYAVEIKYYRTARAQIELVRRAAAIIVHAAARQSLRPVLVVSCNLSGQQRLKLEEEFSITIFDRIDLLITASRFDSLLVQLKPLLDDELHEDAVPESGKDVRAALLAVNQIPRDAGTNGSNQVGSQTLSPTVGHDLCQELRALHCGKKTWRDYEDISERIIDYLFGGHFLQKSKQKITDDGLSRYDLIARATPQTDFWDFVINEVRSRYVIFEFKNYCHKIAQGQILTTEKYLLGPALRKCAFVFCRKGASDSAEKMARGAVRELGKLIIILNDDDLCEMLHMKDSGSDPTDYLFQCSDKIFMTLSR